MHRNHPFYGIEYRGFGRHRGIYRRDYGAWLLAMEQVIHNPSFIILNSFLHQGLNILRKYLYRNGQQNYAKKFSYRNQSRFTQQTLY